MSAAINLRSGKVIDNPFLKNNENRVKLRDDSVQHSNNNTNTTIPTYKLVIIPTTFKK